MIQTNFTEELTLITRQIERLQAQNEQLQAEVAQLKAGQIAAADTRSLPSATRQSRRKLLKHLATLTVGAGAAAATLVTTTSEAKAAAVATVFGTSSPNYGLTASPDGVATFIPNTGLYGLIGVTTQDGIPLYFSNHAGVLGYGNREIGVFGLSHDWAGVWGESTNGPAVIGISANNLGVLGRGDSWGVLGTSDRGTGGKFRGVKATLALEPSTTTGIPTTGVHIRGEIVASNESGDTTNLYLCTQGNDTTVGRWVRLNQPYTAGANIAISPPNPDGTFTISAASNVVFLPSPLRVAASANTSGSLPLLTSNGSGNPDATFQSIQITGTGIPASAKGIIGSLTGVEATKAGNLKLWAFGTPSPAFNTLNIPADPKGTGFNPTAAFTVGLGMGGKVNLGYSNGTAGSTCGFSLDVVAYVL